MNLVELVLQITFMTQNRDFDNFPVVARGFRVLAATPILGKKPRHRDGETGVHVIRIAIATLYTLSWYRELVKFIGLVASPGDSCSD